MSFSEVQRFHDEIKRGRYEFFQLYEELLKSTCEGERNQKIVEFARQHGFRFSLTELNNFIENYEDIDYIDNGTIDAFGYTASLKPTSRDTELRLSIGGLERFFVWLSGASPKILATCSESEQKRQASLGGTILIPVLFSIISSSFLLGTLQFNETAIFFASSVWAVIILLMDRALLSTYRKGFS